MVKERKERISKLTADIAASDAQEAVWTRELVQLLFDDAKDRLVNAEGIDVARIQGEARLAERIFRQMIAANALLGQQRQE
jgi:hypothetical protein